MAGHWHAASAAMFAFCLGEAEGLGNYMGRLSWLRRLHGAAEWASRDAAAFYFLFFRDVCAVLLYLRRCAVFLLCFAVLYNSSFPSRRA